MFARIKADNFTMSLHGRKSDYVPEHYPHDYYPASQPKEEREKTCMEVFRECMGGGKVTEVPFQVGKSDYWVDEVNFEKYYARIHVEK